MKIEPERRGVALADCDFYHSIDLPVSGPQEGQWDLRGRFDDYVGHIDFAGKTVLDVGTASGFLSFEAERRGAEVTSFDVADARLMQFVPIPGTVAVDEYDRWLTELRAYVEALRNSYWLTHEELGSSARRAHGNVYELDSATRFDIVLVGQLLVHLADGFSALAGAARACGDTLVVVEGNLTDKSPIAALLSSRTAPYAWYHYSHGWYRQVLDLLGFKDVRIEVGSFRCNAPGYANNIELITVVARR